MREHQAEQFAKVSKCFDRILSSKPSHPDIPVEELQMMFRAMKRETDAKQRELRDEIDENRQILSELSPHHLQEFDEHFDSLQFEEQLNRAGQEIYELDDKLRALERGPGVESSQIADPEKIRHDFKDIVTQTDTKSETAFTSPSN
ncbi:hypothetical protein NW754_002180 [Fusarium falciforme]|uniref:Uncharacterized protein n=1 Tax=Fusarium falciforme TaxID=195108 RepID=A0A9W8UV32_9HYPO|nr:hypothetical protein NW754_002180 [Fusarium falciforme]KAJ4179898.1 hypothetical protein NW755_012115 [Fusarium falciforme]KAJ4260379.1 hypothetical protein NW757_002330 [Fusarium falciforme]